MCDPVSATFAASAVIGAAGSLYTGSAQAASGRSNAAALEFQRANRLEKAKFDIEAADRKFARFEGVRDANIGSSGIAATSFSDVRADDASEHALENAAIAWSAQNDASMLDFQAESQRRQAKDAQIAGYINAAGAVVGAATGYIGANKKVGVGSGSFFSGAGYGDTGTASYDHGYRP